MEDPQPTPSSRDFLGWLLKTAIATPGAMLTTGGIQLAAALAFYTCFPIPSQWALEFRYVARLVVAVGLLLGSLLGCLDVGLAAAGMPALTRSTAIVISWLAMTGGLHLDGAMDTADGLAVQDPQRRLAVMADSATGAFGAMAAIAILLLKTVALSELHQERWLALMMAASWGRWGQQVAIAQYPYLKPTGKGAFHKSAIRSWWDGVPSLLLLLGLSALPLTLHGNWQLSLELTGGGAIAMLTAAWFHQKLGGHTGDTYGAVVEWTEALFLVLLTLFL